MSESQTDVLVFVVGIPLLLVGLYLWINALRHMIGLLTNFRPGRTWGMFFPFCLFMPYFFTDTGNMHRVKCLKFGGLFMVFCLVPFVVVELLEAWR